MTPRLTRAIVWCAARLAPAVSRDRFIAEWRSELAAAWTAQPMTWSRRWALCRTACASFAHARALRPEDGLVAHVQPRRGWSSGLRQDVAFASRLIGRQPGFAAIAIATIALGVGANTAIFSLVNRSLLTPLPYADPDRLVAVWETVPALGIPENTPAPNTLDLWRSRAHTIASFGEYTVGSVNLTGAGDPTRLTTLRVGASLLDVLGVTPVLGRNLTADEARYDGARVVLLTHAAWIRYFAGDPHIVGRTITLNGAGATVIGVLPREMPMTIQTADVWVPLALPPDVNRESRMLFVVGRLAPGATATAAQRELDAKMHAPGPDRRDDGIGVYVESLDEQLRGGVRPDLWMVFGVSAAVLLIACLNVAAMLLVRGLGRRREFTVRTALGASRARLVRLLTIEGAVLAGAGGVLGLGLGVVVLRIIGRLMPASIASTVSWQLDARVLAFAIAATVLTTIVSGIVPAFVGAGSLVVSTRGGGSDERRATRLMRNGLLVGELALAVVLLAGAALLVQSFSAFVHQPLGLNPDGIVTAQVPRADRDDARRTAFLVDLLERASAMPGVTHAGLINGVPIRFTGGGSGFQIADSGNPMRTLNAHHRIIGGDYFEAMGIPLVAGRAFSPHESGRVAIVSEAFAKSAWGSRAAAPGRRIQWGADGQWIDVVGVVGDVRLSPTAPLESHVYLPFTAVEYSVFAPGDLVLRTTGDPGAVARELRGVVHAMDPAQPVSSIITMHDLLSQAFGKRRFTLQLMSAFAALALLLASIGLYGVASYAVNRRLREIGIRLALGATARQIRVRILGQGAVWTVVGVGLGLTAGAALLRWARAEVPGLESPGIWPIVAAAFVLIAAAIVACDIPARRAMRVDPLITLKAE